jgi:hypothetical protein
MNEPIRTIRTSPTPEIAAKNRPHGEKEALLIAS